MASGPLLHRIDRAIQQNPHSIRSRIFLESAPGKVILRGKVDSFYQKQMIQESLRNIEESRVSPICLKSKNRFRPAS